jgi:uncharacterized protein YacL
MMPPRSPFRTNSVVFAVIGLVVGLLIHFIVLSSPRYNWINPLTVTVPAGGSIFQDIVQHITVCCMYVVASI